MALGDAILVCLTERPMTGYELAKTFDASIGFSGRPTTSKSIASSLGFAIEATLKGARSCSRANQTS